MPGPPALGWAWGHRCPVSSSVTSKPQRCSLCHVTNSGLAGARQREGYLRTRHLCPSHQHPPRGSPTDSLREFANKPSTLASPRSHCALRSRDQLCSAPGTMGAGSRRRSLRHANNKMAGSQGSSQSPGTRGHCTLSGNPCSPEQSCSLLAKEKHAPGSWDQRTAPRR